MAGVDELEEEHGAVLGDRQVADLVHHEQRGMSEDTQAAGQLAGCLGLHQGLDQSGQGSVVDAAAGLGSGDGEAYGKMSLPDTWRTRHILPAITVAR